MAEVILNVWEFRGILEILSKLGVREVVVKVERGEVTIRVLNPNHTVLVEVTGSLTSVVPDGYMYISDVDLLLRLMSRKSPSDTVGGEVRKDGSVFIEDTEVGKHAETLEKLKEMVRGVEAPEDVPTLKFDLHTTVDVYNSNMFRSFLRKVEEYDADATIFVGCRADEPFIGFVARDVPMITFPFRDGSCWGASAATTVSVGNLVATLPYTWVRASGAPRIEMRLPGTAMPLVVMYSNASLYITIYIAPTAEYDEAETKRFLDRSPTAYEKPEGTVATLTIPTEILDKLTPVFKEAGFGVAFLGSVAEIFSMSDDKTWGYRLQPNVYNLSGSAEGVFKLFNTWIINLFDVLPYLATEALIHVTDNGRVYIYNIEVGTLNRSGQEYYEDYRMFMEVRVKVYENWSFSHDSSVRYIRDLVSRVEEAFAEEVGRRRRRTAVTDVYFVLTSDRRLFAYYMGDVKELIRVEGLRRGIEVKYSAIQVSKLRTALAPFRVTNRAELLLGSEDQAVPMMLGVDSDYGRFEAVFAPRMLEDKALEKMGLIVKPPPKPEEKVAKALSEARARFELVKEKYELARRNYLWLLSDIVGLIRGLEDGIEIPKMARESAEHYTKKAGEFLKEIDETEQYIRDFIEFLDRLPEEVRRSEEVAGMRKQAEGMIEELRGYAESIRKNLEKMNKLLTGYEERYTKHFAEMVVERLEKEGVPRGEAEKLVERHRDEITKDALRATNFDEELEALRKWVDVLKEEHRTSRAVAVPKPEEYATVKELNRKFTEVFDRYKATRSRYLNIHLPELRFAVEHLERADLPPFQMDYTANGALKTADEALAEIGEVLKMLRDLLGYIDSLPESVKSLRDVADTRRAILGYIDELNRYAEEAKGYRKRIEELRSTYLERYRKSLLGRVVSELEKVGVPRAVAENLVEKYRDDILRECEATRNYGEQEAVVARWVSSLRREYEASKPRAPPELEQLAREVAKEAEQLDKEYNELYKEWEELKNEYDKLVRLFSEARIPPEQLEPRVRAFIERANKLKSRSEAWMEKYKKYREKLDRVEKEKPELLVLHLPSNLYMEVSKHKVWVEDTLISDAGYWIYAVNERWKEYQSRYRPPAPPKPEVKPEAKPKAPSIDEQVARLRDKYRSRIERWARMILSGEKLRAFMEQIDTNWREAESDIRAFLEAGKPEEAERVARDFYAEKLWILTGLAPKKAREVIPQSEFEEFGIAAPPPVAPTAPQAPQTYPGAPFPAYRPKTAIEKYLMKVMQYAFFSGIYPGLPAPTTRPGNPWYRAFGEPDVEVVGNTARLDYSTIAGLSKIAQQAGVRIEVRTEWRVDELKRLINEIIDRVDRYAREWLEDLLSRLG